MIFWVSTGVVLVLVGALTTRLRLTLIVRPGREVLLRFRWGLLTLRLPLRSGAGRSARPPKRQAGHPKPPKSAADRRTNVRSLLKPVRESARILLRGLRVDRFYCHIVAGAGDAAHAALLYGSLHTALGLVTPLLTRVKRPNLTVDLDYGIPRPRVYLLASVSIRPFAILRAALCFLRRPVRGQA
jgi:hypothetical protein